jgi:hypothetical protein
MYTWKNCGADSVSQAQKFTAVSDDDDDELEEESLLETPLDKVEPYTMFKHALLRMVSLAVEA